jgi:hypothetical protein
VWRIVKITFITGGGGGGGGTLMGRAKAFRAVSETNCERMNKEFIVRFMTL